MSALSYKAGVALLPVILANRDRLPADLVAIAVVLDGYRKYWIPEYEAGNGSVSYMHGSSRAEHHERFIEAESAYEKALQKYSGSLSKLCP